MLWSLFNADLGGEMGRVGGTITALVLAAILAGSGFVFWRFGLVSFNRCQVDDEIALRDREAAANASLAFIDLVRAGETTAVLERMSRAGLQATERTVLVNLVEESLSVPAGQLEVRHTYDLWSIGTPQGYAPCNNDDGVAFVARGGGPHTMFTTIAESIGESERAWSFWLERDRGAWRVRGVHLGLSMMAGRDGAALWALAEEQRRQNNVFNSTLLYDLAYITLNRGGFLQPAEANGFARARQMWRRHQDVIQRRFHLGERSFPIAGMQARATGDGNFVLMLDQASDEPVTVAEAIVRNRAFIDGMNAYRPEWREVFDALSVGSPTGARRVWRTAYMREGGYVMDSPPTEQPQD